jgi:outer membrane protein OmpA-like peptidoglycan-associated protein
LLPESFDFTSPANHELLYDTNPLLQWQSTIDPDPYDNVRYLVLAAYDDSMKVRQAINLAKVDFEHLLGQTSGDGWAACAAVDSNRYRMADLTGGDYFWTIIAYDGDRHIRLAGAGGENIRRFTVVDQNLMITEGQPPAQWLSENLDVAIKSMVFEPISWITTTPEQGIVRVTVENRGRLKLDSLLVAVYDRFSPPADSIPPLFTDKDGAGQAPAMFDSLIGASVIKNLAADEQRVLKFDWQTNRVGRHTLVAVVDEGQAIPELNEDNNRLAEVFSTIPKGTVSCPPSTIAFNIDDLSNDVPFIAVAYFDKGSARVNGDYLRRWPLTPPLQVLAERLKAYPGRRISVQGFADPVSGENSAALADQRSAAVRDELIAGGASPDQIAVLPGKVLPGRRLPANAEDAEAVLQERRCVNIVADDATAAVLFQPIHTDIIDTTFVPVNFDVDLRLSEPLTWSAFFIRLPHAADSLFILAPVDSTQSVARDVVEWSLQGVPNPAAWIGKPFAYAMHVQDRLGRHFRTRESSARLDSSALHVRHQIYGPAKFGKAEPLYEFYWNVLFAELSRMLSDKTLRVRFIGHACSIGSLEINEKLSQLRAAKFRERFLEEIRVRLPENYAELQDRVDLAVGLGETVPLRVDLDSATRVLLGNNRTPLGRVLNRRIEVTFYTPTEQLTSAEPR